MRPVRPGVYGTDLAAVARVRRRIASDVEQPVSWRKAMIKHCDDLYAGLEAVVDAKLLGTRPKAKRKRKVVQAAVEG